MNRFSIIALMSLLALNSTFAQIVNVEKCRKAGQRAFEVTFFFETQIKDVGDDIFELKTNADIQYTQGKSRWIFLNYNGFMKYNGKEIQNLGYQHLRYNYTFRDSSAYTWEIFAQNQYNEVKLFKRRIISGSGPRIRMANNRLLKWYLAALGMYEYEQLLDSSRTEIQTIRLDAYTSASIDVSETLSFKHITYYQPAFQNVNDYRISSETFLRIDLFKKAAVDIGYAFDYDSKPPAEVQNYFYSYFTKFVFKF